MGETARDERWVCNFGESMGRHQNEAIRESILWLMYVATTKWRYGHFGCCDLVVSEPGGATSLLSGLGIVMSGASQRSLLDFGYL